MSDLDDFVDEQLATDPEFRRYHMAQMVEMKAEIEQLRAENERLRSSLDEVLGALREPKAGPHAQHFTKVSVRPEGGDDE